jgi:hypothetical protein
MSGGFEVPRPPHCSGLFRTPWTWLDCHLLGRREPAIARGVRGDIAPDHRVDTDGLRLPSAVRLWRGPGRLLLLPTRTRPGELDRSGKIAWSWGTVFFLGAVGHTCSAKTLEVGMYQKLVAVSLICLLVLASGCVDVLQTSPPGSVYGFLETNAGPSNTATRPLPGTVYITSRSTGKVRSLEIGTNGLIWIRLAHGTWTATGRSPLVTSGSREVTCHSLTPVVVHSRRTTDANVIRH